MLLLLEAVASFAKRLLPAPAVPAPRAVLVLAEAEPRLLVGARPLRSRGETVDIRFALSKVEAVSDDAFSGQFGSHLKREVGTVQRRRVGCY